MALTQRFYVNCTAEIDLLLVTHEVKRAVAESKVKSGLVSITVPIGAGGITLIENDREVQEAFRDLLVSLVPTSDPLKAGPRPERRSKTGATALHLRALLMGSALTLPVIEGKLEIGPWQEILLYDFNDRVGRREFCVHVIAEPEAAAGARPPAGAARPGGQPLGRIGQPGPSGPPATTLPPGQAKAV